LEFFATGSESGTTATVYANGLTASSLSSMAVDTSFNVYLASGSPSNPEIYIFPYGSYSSVNTFTGSAVGYPVAMGLDQVNDIFFGNYAANNLSEIQEGSDIGNTANGGTFSGGGLNKPHKLVLDGSSDIWTTNTVTSGSGVVSEFASADTPSYTAQSVISPVGGYGSVTGTVLTARNYNESYGIALDASGNVWVGAGAGSTITEIVGAATPVITPIASNLPATANAVTNVPVPTSTVYFGAWANPTAGNTGPALVESYTSTLESQVGRTFATHMHYYGWGTDGSTVASATPAFPDQAEIDDAAAGRIPVITWACSDLNSVVAAASSTVNTSTFNLIVATALAVKAFAKPMFIRWNWEMNLTSGNKCMGSGTSTQQQQNYINAWQNIYNIFKAQGVTNVSWLWNPGGAVADPDAAPFYPGNAYVDWIGFDGYDKVNAHDFGGVFNHFYQEYENSTYGNKPILIAETGECPTLQQLWLSTAVAEIAGRANTGNYDFSMVKGFMYFDAPGQYGGCVWNFDSEGITGFAVMGADPYFDAP
jgi:hypothetical protein